MAIATTDPRTGEVVETFAEATPEEIEASLALAHEAFALFRRTSFEERARWMRRAGDLLDAEREDVAATMTLEMGKPVVQAEAEAAKCATAMRFYAEHAARFLADEPLADPAAVGASRAATRWQPLGVVLAVMPWNFPLWQVVRFAAPALMAGNVGLLKHASNVPRCALYLHDLFARAGFPSGAFQSLLIGSGAVDAVLRDRRVVAATVTGSEPAGAAVASTAGEEIKPTVLELGGSDAFVVMPTAEVDEAVSVAVKARTQNNGQSCIAAKRFIVHADVYDAFTAGFVDAMSSLRVGDPMERDTDVGPLATRGGLDDVVALLDDARAKGARVLCGGEVPEVPGWFFPPTVVAEVTEEMDLYREEAFGPVATLLRVGSIEEAIDVANATDFGLGSNAWTNDPDEQERFVDELQAGAVFVNGMTTSYPELPFGGIKRSGYGRELSAAGIRAFCNSKTVWIA